MLGPLPAMYRHRLTLIATLVFVALGAWIAARTELPILPATGAVLGAIVGLAAAYLLVHDFRHEQSR